MVSTVMVITAGGVLPGERRGVGGVLRVLQVAVCAADRLERAERDGHPTDVIRRGFRVYLF